MTNASATPSRDPRRSRRPEPADDPAAPSPAAAGHRPRIALALQALAVPIESVALHPNNPRLGDVEAVAASLRRFGQQKPIVIQASSGWAVAGNHLLLAAQSLGWTEIAANVVEMDDATATGFMLADNRTSDLGGYNEQLLAAILAEAAAADNLAATGYDADDVAALVAAAGLTETRDLDDCPDLPAPAEVYVRPGDLFELGRHQLLVGDATRGADVRRLVGGASLDLLVTDPPYGVAYTGKTRRALTITNNDRGEAGTRQLVAEALRTAPLRAGGGFYLFAPAGPLHLAFLLAVRDAGLAVHQTFVWVKDQFVLGHRWWRVLVQIDVPSDRKPSPHLSR
jgi:ParB-like chromosome segregation protein Spo0J